MARLLDDDSLRRRLGAEARLYARSHLSWENCALVCESVYERLLRQSGPRRGEAPPGTEHDDDEDPVAETGYARR